MRQQVIFLEGLSLVTSGIKLRAFDKKIIIPTIKHGGGRVMVLDCFAAS